MITTHLPASRLRRMLCLALPLFLLILAGAPGGPAEALQALKVAGLSPGTGSSSPTDFCQVGETLFFRANDGFNGSELWKLKGNDTAPVMVADLNPSGSSFPNDLTEMGEALYFFAEGPTGIQLCTSDGTEEGTKAVTALTGGFTDLGELTGGDSRLFFFAAEDSYGEQVWTSDGTQAGTFPVTQFTLSGARQTTIVGPRVFNGELCVVGDQAYFCAYDESHGYELWVSDGTAGGTGLACDLVEGTDGSYPSDLTPLGTSLAFLGRDTESYQVYRLDEGSSDPLKVTSLDRANWAALHADGDGSLVIFAQSYRDDNTFEIWELEAAAASADLVDTVAVTSADAIRAEMPLGRLNGELVFPLLKAVEDAGTVTYDVTSEIWGLGEEGAHMIASLGAERAYPEKFALLEDTACFMAQDDATGRGRLWKTDGTSEGTTAVTGIGEGVSVGDLQAFGPTLLLAVHDPHHGTELWTSDGTAEGTGLFADINLRTAGESFVWNDRIYMGGWDDSGPGLWVSDGTASGTEMLASTPPTAGYCPEYFFDGEERFYFLAGGNGVDVRLWTCDGTAEGTVELTHLGPETIISPERALQELDGKRYFLRHQRGARYPVASPELWGTNGTAEGTVLVTALGEEAFFSRNLARTNEGLVLDVYDYDTREVTLWASDGSADGTAPLSADLGESWIYEMVTVASGDAYFLLSSRTGDFMLWKTDGTGQGTAQIAVIGTDGRAAAANLTPCGNKVFFRVHLYATQETELWVTEGTEDTTHQVAAINPAGNDDADNLTVLEDRLFFSANDGTHGRELWTSDGTAEGTVMVADLDPDGSSNPTDLTVMGNTSALSAEGATGSENRLFFSADDGRHGRELWNTDGTEEGTLRITCTGSETGPQNPVLLDGDLFFTAADGEGDTDLMKAVAGSSGCSATGLPALGLVLLPLLGLLKR